MASSTKPKQLPIGTYRQQKLDPINITCKDFGNLATFFTIYKLSTFEFLKWMQKEGLILSEYTCVKCAETCKVYAKKSVAIGYSFRCGKNKNHEKTILTNSYFKHGNVHPQDVLLFIRSYLIGLSNINCSSETGIGQDTGE